MAVEPRSDAPYTEPRDETLDLPPVARWAVGLLATCIAGGLGYVVTSFPESDSGLRETVIDALGRSGVDNPVTAVLLNFRGYDTLLEMGVLLLALLGVWSLSATPLPRGRAGGAVLDALLQVLIPVMMLVAGYLLWVGASAPGGAFQAGAVLAGAGVLALLAGERVRGELVDWPLRILIVSGLAIFVLVAAAAALRGGKLLEYPEHSAGLLILLIEVVATLSIGATLTVLFLGGRPTGKKGE